MIKFQFLNKKILEFKRLTKFYKINESTNKHSHYKGYPLTTNG